MKNKKLEKSRSEDIIEDEHTFKILIATDTHLGYKHTCKDQHDDSFNTMEEIFQIYGNSQPDFLLMGGDIFEKNNPSASVLERAIQLFMKYVPGEVDHKFRLLSDPVKNFCVEGEEVPDTLPRWENGYFPVAKPIMTIHGNHDNPTGELDSTVLEYFAELGLLSQFGRRTKLSDGILRIYPVLLQKGQTKIAIYGWGWITDMRFRSIVDLGNVVFEVPEDHEDYFNILVVHQNRVPRSSKTDYYQDDEIPDFIDYVLWGHEHDQKYDWRADKRTLIDQPGATVVTSLTNGELEQRRIGMLTIRRKKNELFWRHDKIPLDTSRIFIFRDFVLSDYVDFEVEDVKQLKQQIASIILAQVKDMKQECDLKRQKSRKLAPEMPLLRLRVLQEAGIPKMKLREFLTAKDAKEYAINTDIVKYKNPIMKKERSSKFFGFDEMDAAIFAEERQAMLPIIEKNLAENEPLEFLHEIAMTNIIQGKIDELEGETTLKGLNELPDRIKAFKDFLYDRAAANFMKAYENKQIMTESSTDPVECARDIQRFLQKLRLEDLKEYKPDEMVAQARERARTSQNKSATQKLNLTPLSKSPTKKRKYTRKKAN
ncbi:Oidioi.mRNA.OKI2018_I69.PAR.g12509.t1.cds [Oikopleura dioica]|uniref:Oidioi.mRNA.OKI2018_I69.PAR.g12509.t1.cds n=1 Tax=Oikopleura dioica TaxID=34765 RepID=A0ABN7S487_OIKDI|nr:Oidioi.mRNA.OKI2018_I69.PAR.g12509.t1.cds [Oikopleura dioica]